MVKNNLKKKRTNIIFIAVLSLLVAIGIYLPKASAYNYTSQLFNGSGVSIKNSEKITDNVGLIMTAKYNNTFAKFHETLSGQFSMDFSLNSVEEDELLAFKFTDKLSEESFKLYLKAGLETDTYFIEVAGKKGGIYYAKTGETGGYTELMNNDQYYTQVSKTDINSIVFNPNTMCVYANNKLIWNLLALKNDGYSLGVVYEGFKNYEMEIVFEKINGGSSEVLIKSLCNQTLKDNYIKVDDGKPSIYADVKLNTIKGTTYKIPQPYVYDISDGKIESNKVSVIVVDSSGKEILNKKWEEDIFFLAEKGLEEKYKLTYEVYDNSNNLEQITFNIISYSTQPKANFTYSNILSNIEVGCFEYLELPSAFLKTPMLINNGERIPEIVVWKKVDNVFKEYHRVLADTYTDYKLKEAGEYKITCEFVYPNLDIKEEIAKIQVSENKAGFSFVHFESKYFYNQKLEIPDAYVSLNNFTIPTTSMIVYPDGSSYNSKQITLNQKGIYYVIYKGIIEDQSWSKTYTFKVEYSPDQIFYNGIIDASIKTYPYDESFAGMNLYMKAETPVKYSEVIDFSKYDKDDTLIELMAISPVKNKLIYNKIYITLRDPSDFNNYITIFINGKTSTSSSYLLVKTSGYSYHAITNNNVNTTGLEIAHSFSSAELTGRKAVDNTISIKYDYKLGKLYARQLNGEYALFADFNNKDFIEKIGNFTGFKDDKGLLEISFEYLDRQEVIWHDQAVLFSGANLMLLKLAGYEFNTNGVVDLVSPEITLDAPRNLPQAIVGKEYRLFDSTAFDIVCGKVLVNKRVVYNYGSNQYVDVFINNNKFIPKYKGEYTLIYSAVDDYGNESQILKKVFAIEENPYDLNIEIISDNIEDYTQGQNIKVRNIKITGGVGDYYDIKIEAKYPDGSLNLVTDGEFLSLLSGQYEIIYTVNDYVFNSFSTKYILKVAEQLYPQLIDELVVQPVMTAGQLYVLPLVKAYDFSAKNQNILTPEIYVQYPEEDFIKIEKPQSFIVEESKVNHGSVLNFKYKYIGEKAESTYLTSTCVAVLKTKSGEINFKDYFVYSKTYGELAQSYVRFKTNGSGSVIFGKKLLANNFSMSLNLTDQNLSKMHIRLTDNIDPSISVLLTIQISTTNSSYYSYSANGGSEKNFAAATSQRLADVSFDNIGKVAYLVTNTSVSTGNTTTLKIENTENGEVFKGFLSGFVNVELFFESKTNNTTTVVLYNMSRQSISGIKDNVTEEIKGTVSDYLGPTISVSGEYSGSIKQGESFIIPSAIAGDVLSFAGQVYVTVSMPGGGYLKAKNGVVLNNAPADIDYEIEPEILGRYGIKYNCTDSNGAITELITRPLYVNQPAINSEILVKYEYAVASTGKVNTTIKLPSVTTEENVTTLIAVYHKSGESVALSKNNEFTPSKANEYTACYVYYDLSGRFKVEEFIIIVS